MWQRIKYLELEKVFKLFLNNLHLYYGVCQVDHVKMKVQKCFYRSIGINIFGFFWDIQHSLMYTRFFFVLYVRASRLPRLQDKIYAPIKLIRAYDGY